MADIKLGAVSPIAMAGLRIATGRSGASTSSGAASVEATASDNAASAAAAQSLGAGAVPVDDDRVLQIRKAIADGNYPVIPSRVGDAIIAAGILVWSSK
jgi:negative regulator of flagellin synthesis FlgM